MRFSRFIFGLYLVTLVKLLVLYHGFKLYLLKIIDGHILQRKFFAVKYVIHGTKDLYDAAKGHLHEGSHRGGKRLYPGKIQIARESQLAQIMIAHGRSARRTNHDRVSICSYDAVIVEIRCCKVTNMLGYRKYVI